MKDFSMHKATCDSCGNSCEVPFRPTGGRPIYCSQCFENNGGGRDSGGGNRSFESRSPRKFGNNSSSQTTMHRATCDACGNSCEVPFRPTAGKPIFCSSCFERNGGGDRNRDSRDSREYREPRGNQRYGNDSSQSTMHKAICDTCGNSCEVPFRPTSGKPIYCSSCFENVSEDRGRGRGDSRGDRRSDSRGRGTDTDQVSEQFAKLNAKLDKVLDRLYVLEGGKPKTDSKKETKKVEAKKEVKVVVAEKVAPEKKVISKKAAVKKEEVKTAPKKIVVAKKVASAKETDKKVAKKKTAAKKTATKKTK